MIDGVPNRPPRLREFDYRGPFQYFITVCVRNRRPVFEELHYGRSVRDHFLQLAEEEGFEVVAYCVMPDHFHALLTGLTDDADLQHFMHRWKQRTGHWWCQQVEPNRLWQDGFYDHILRPQDPESGVVRYIAANPSAPGW